MKDRCSISVSNRFHPPSKSFGASPKSSRVASKPRWRARAASPFSPEDEEGEEEEEEEEEERGGGGGGERM
eukprot:3774385-Rhodomonas_salina.1